MKSNTFLPLLLAVAATPSHSYADPIPNNPIQQKALDEMSEMKRIVRSYRAEKHSFPLKTRDVLDQATVVYRQEGKVYKTFLEQVASQKKGSSSFLIPYFVKSRRLSGAPYSAPKDNGTRDVVLYTDKFFTPNENIHNPLGFYSVLWDDMQSDFIPYDCLVYAIKPTDDPNNYFRTLGFMGEGGCLENTLSYEEFWVNAKYKYPPIGKPTSKPNVTPEEDNGVDSLVILSRYLSKPSRYGFDRTKLWTTFNPRETEFGWAEVEAGAKKLGLPVQLSRLSLAQLANKRTVAILFMKEDGRLVTLTALDADRAVVVDRGLTRNIERSLLEELYFGEALLPTKALTQRAALVAEDSVRKIQLPSREEGISQTVMLRNTGDKPVTLQLEYPLLGVSQAKLSHDALPPGETATLQLTLKWRSVLKTPTQNVLVSLQTSDPIVPRLQLAFQLVPPPSPQ